jgi:hypothetical protein
MSTALLLAVFVSLKRERDGLAGLFLALGLYKPQLVLPLAGCLLMARRWYSLSIFGVTGMVLVGISVWMVGLQGIFDFLSILRSMNHYSYIIYPPNMPNIRGLIHDLFYAEATGSLSFALTGIMSVVAYLLCLFLWRGDFDALNSIFDLQFSLTLLTTILISYHLYPHDLLPVVVAAILLFRYINIEGASHKNLSLAFYIVLLVLFLPVVPRYLISASVLGWAALPMSLLYAILIGEIVQRKHLKINTKSGAATTAAL